MSEWWTYSPANFLMFTARTYYRLFERHNAALWPAHIAALLAGAVVLALLWRRPDPRTARIAASVLVVGCLVVAGAYFWGRYSTIHNGGRWFAVAFAMQALALGWCGVVRAGHAGTGLELETERTVRRRAGLGIFLFSALLYPLLAPLSGRPWGQSEVFGLVPDPTALATLGLLLVAKRAPRWLWIVPVGWCVFSAMTLWTLHAPEAFGLIGGLVTSVVLAGLSRGQRSASPSTD